MIPQSSNKPQMRKIHQQGNGHPACAPMCLDWSVLGPVLVTPLWQLNSAKCWSTKQNFEVCPFAYVRSTCGSVESVESLSLRLCEVNATFEPDLDACSRGSFMRLLCSQTTLDPSLKLPIGRILWASPSRFLHEVINLLGRFYQWLQLHAVRRGGAGRACPVGRRGCQQPAR